MGAVHLTVADLDRSLRYYEQQIGLLVQQRENGTARLGAGGEDLLVLTEQPGARPADGYAGLFHFALLVPTREDLGRWLAHAASDRVPLSGLSDHFVSEAIYLRDPDHHGIEIYADRPREIWEGKVWEQMTTLPLDTDDLLRGIEPAAYEGMPGGTTMGHVHLCVTDVEASVDFYRSLGFDLMAMYGDQAAFLSSEGYHHHIGANTWQSKGAPYAPDDRARLTGFTVLGAPEERELRDPSGIPLAFATAG
ncbi:MAG TPA: VOC family protein [Gaiellaceae bacterium]|nr:VOC family protein [Gaiellaceae bacterium]